MYEVYMAHLVVYVGFAYHIGFHIVYIEAVSNFISLRGDLLVLFTLIPPS